MLTIGDKFPDYELIAVSSSDRANAFNHITAENFTNKWKIYFFWPKDFNFVCPTEIIGFGKLNQDFLLRDTQLIGGSTDSEFVHLAWREHHPDLTNSPFPWLAY